MVGRKKKSRAARKNGQIGGEAVRGMEMGSVLSTPPNQQKSLLGPFEPERKPNTPGEKRSREAESSQSSKKRYDGNVAGIVSLLPRVSIMLLQEGRQQTEKNGQR